MKRKGLAVLFLTLVMSCLFVATSFAEERITIATVEGESVILDIDDNDELFAGYVEQLFNPRTLFRVTKPLGGVEGDIFNQLKPVITDIADGKTESTAIPVILPLSQFNITKGQKFYAVDLNITSVLDSKKEPTDEAINALFGKLNYNLSLVNRHLLAVCPYELYWYDKTEEGGVMSSISAWYGYGTDSKEIFYPLVMRR